MADMKRVEMDHRAVAAAAFALIDPLAGNASDLAPWATFVRHSCAPRGFEAQAGQLPILVELRDLTTSAFNHVLRLVLDNGSNPSLCVALLRSYVGASSMALHLRSRLAPHFPQGRRGIFRFPDPVVFEHLAWILDDREWASLLGPVAHWYLPVRKTWYALSNPAETLHRGLPFHPRADAWPSIMRLGATHAVLAGDMKWEAEPAIWGPRANALLARAEQHGLTEREDAVAFAIQGLRWHTRLDAHPRIRLLLSECAGHPARYRRLSGRMCEDDWQTIAVEIDASQPVPPTTA
jgi:hypothetical protein